MASIHSISSAVQGGVLVGHFERGTRAVHSGNALTFRSQVKGEASLITEDVEGIALERTGCGGVVFSLVEKGAGFLAFQSFVVEANAASATTFDVASSACVLPRLAPKTRARTWGTESTLPPPFMVIVVELFLPHSRPDSRGGSCSRSRMRGSTRSTIPAGRVLRRVSR